MEEILQRLIEIRNDIVGAPENDWTIYPEAAAEECVAVYVYNPFNPFILNKKRIELVAMRKWTIENWRIRVENPIFLFKEWEEADMFKDLASELLQEWMNLEWVREQSSEDYR